MPVRSRKRFTALRSRHTIKVFVVANMPMRVPAEELIEFVVVRGGFDAADDWIVERIAAGDIAITADILLADRCLRKGGVCTRAQGKSLY